MRVLDIRHYGSFILKFYTEIFKTNSTEGSKNKLISCYFLAVLGLYLKFC